MANNSDDQVNIIDAATNTLAGSISVGNNPYAIAVTPTWLESIFGIDNAPVR